MTQLELPFAPNFPQRRVARKTVARVQSLFAKFAAGEPFEVRDIERIGRFSKAAAVRFALWLLADGRIEVASEWRHTIFFRVPREKSAGHTVH